jgi:hypothetical protein
MPLPSFCVVVVVRCYHYLTHQNQPGSCMSVPPSERIELPLNTHSYACFHKQNMYDEKLNWNKSSTWASNSLELRISCAQLKIMRIHDSKFQTNAKVWSNLISNLESKAKAITCGEFGTGVIFWRWGTKIPTQTPESRNFPNFHQQLSGIIMHTFGIQR